MVVVVLRNKQCHVNHAHRFLQARVNRRACNLSIVHGFKALDEFVPARTEQTEQPGHKLRVVVCVERLLVCQIRRAKGLSAGIVVVQPDEMKFLEVQQVADMFLD